MWAVVWALYALWKSASEMEQIAKDIPFLRLMETWGNLGLFKWNNVEAYLDELFWGKYFEDTKIPFSTTATDIDTGEGIVFPTGKLSEAVRASISLPGIFYPKEIDERSLVDGGLTNNLPVELLPEGKVIAVSALRDIKRKIPKVIEVFWIEWKRSIFWNTYDIIQKTTDIMLTQNENRSIESREEVLYVRPEFDTLDYYNFLEYKMFIEAGYAASGEIIDFLED